MTATPDTVVEIDGAVYTLNGLIKAYRDLLKDYADMVDDRIGMAISKYLDESPDALMRAMTRCLTMAGTARAQFCAELAVNIRFVDVVAEKVADCIQQRQGMTINEQVRGAAQEWYNGREPQLRTLIRNILENEFASRQRQYDNFEAAFMQLTKPAVQDALASVGREDSHFRNVISDMVENRINMMRQE